MKRTYMIPEMEIIEIQIQHQMLAGSVGIDPDVSPIDPSLADGREFDDEFGDEFDFDE